MAWAAVSITEVVLLAYLTRKAAGEGVSVRRGQFNVKMSPPPLDEFTFARNSPQKSGIQPKKSLDSGTAPKVRMAPPGFNTSRRRKVLPRFREFRKCIRTRIRMASSKLP